MMALNVVKEQQGVGRLWAAKAGARQGLVVAAGGSGRGGHKDRAEPLALGVCRVGVFLWAHPVTGGIQGADRAPSWVPTRGAPTGPQGAGGCSGDTQLTPMAPQLVLQPGPQRGMGFPQKSCEAMRF